MRSLWRSRHLSQPLVMEQGTNCCVTSWSQHAFPGFALCSAVTSQEDLWGLQVPLDEEWCSKGWRVQWWPEAPPGTGDGKAHRRLSQEWLQRHYSASHTAQEIHSLETAPEPSQEIQGSGPGLDEQETGDQMQMQLLCNCRLRFQAAVAASSWHWRMDNLIRCAHVGAASQKTSPFKVPPPLFSWEQCLYCKLLSFLERKLQHFYWFHPFHHLPILLRTATSIFPAMPCPCPCAGVCQGWRGQWSIKDHSSNQRDLQELSKDLQELQAGCCNGFITLFNNSEVSEKCIYSPAIKMSLKWIIHACTVSPKHWPCLWCVQLGDSDGAFRCCWEFVCVLRFSVSTSVIPISFLDFMCCSGYWQLKCFYG